MAIREIVFDVEYSVWKAITQTGSLAHAYKTTQRTNRILVYSGNTEKAFRAMVDPSEYSDWSTNFSSGAFLVNSEDEAVSKIVEAASGGIVLNTTIVELRPSSSAVTNIAGSTSTVTFLAANSERLGASVHNDSNKDLYLKLGSAASSTDYTVKMEPDFHYEVPFRYVGILTGVWPTGVTGKALVTEYTP